MTTRQLLFIRNGHIAPMVSMFPNNSYRVKGIKGKKDIAIQPLRLSRRRKRKPQRFAESYLWLRGVDNRQKIRARRNAKKRNQNRMIRKRKKKMEL